MPCSLGGLYLDAAVYEAQCLAATGFDASQGVPPDLPRKQAVGEQLHDLLQAACRIGIRKGAEVTKEHHVYLISATPQRLTERLRKAFPGCEVIEWLPFGNALRGLQKALVDYVLERLPPGSDAFIRFPTILRDLAINETTQLTQLRGHPAVGRAFEAEGIIEDASVPRRPGEGGGRRRNTGYRRPHDSQ